MKSNKNSDEQKQNIKKVFKIYTKYITVKMMVKETLIYRNILLVVWKNHLSPNFAIFIFDGFSMK